MKDYCYRKVKKKFKVFPSRYAGFALSKCRRRLVRNPVEGWEPDIFDLEQWAILSKDKEVRNFYEVARYLPYDKLYDLLLKLWKKKGSEKIWTNPRPPKAVARVACRGLKKRRKYKRGGTAVGVARARDLCNRKNVSMRTVKRMSSYFARHRASRAENRRRIVDPVSPARIADELWGGTPGYRWVRQVLG